MFPRRAWEQVAILDVIFSDDISLFIAFPLLLLLCLLWQKLFPPRLSLLRPLAPFRGETFSFLWQTNMRADGGMLVQQVVDVGADGVPLGGINFEDHADHRRRLRFVDVVGIIDG